MHGVGTILDRVGADVLVGFGGYVATPAYLAAKRHKVPIVVHEANPLAGIANRLGAHLTTHVFTGHPDTKLRNSVYLGIPIRRQIAELDRFALGDKARAHFGLRLDLPVLLVFGGSQGAMSLNRALAGAVGPITNAGVQVLHVTGPKHLNEITPPAGPVPYVALPYVDRMDLAYAAADFALCRAGAMTCAELTAVGLPAAYVPLPIGNGEQRLNALPIVQRGGGLLVDDAELTAEWIKSSLLPVLTNIDQVAGMSEAAAALGRKDADRWLAKAVIDIVAAEAANRAGAAEPAAARQPAPRPAPAAARPSSSAAAAAPPPRSRAACSRRARPGSSRRAAPISRRTPPSRRTTVRAAGGRRPARAGRPAGTAPDRREQPPDRGGMPRRSVPAAGQAPPGRPARSVRRPSAVGSASADPAPAGPAPAGRSRPGQPPQAHPASPGPPHPSPGPGVTGRRGYSELRGGDARDGAGDAHRTGAARGARASALRRHRRRGDVRHRPDHAGQGRAGLRQ